MKAVTVKEISQELLNLTPKELRDLCLRLARFKKENKELLTYLLFEASDEASYVESVKKEIDLQFDQVNRKSNYYIKKGLRILLFKTEKIHPFLSEECSTPESVFKANRINKGKTWLPP
jgi:hypothetical protein